jgi:hypothetical protein
MLFTGSYKSMCSYKVNFDNITELKELILVMKLLHGSHTLVCLPRYLCYDKDYDVINLIEKNILIPRNNK